MNQETVTINCREHDAKTNMARPFNVIKYTFNYQSSNADKELIDSLIAEGTRLANSVNPGAANDSNLKRSYNRILSNCIAGVVSEYLWKNYLNQVRETVTTTEMENAGTQIDLAIISNNKKVEVRSSFPRNGIPFAVCSLRHQFDIIGPYSNGYKPGEIQKDYYIRALFHLQNPTDLLGRIKQNGFEACLTGGATWLMMTDPQVAIEKSFIPDDEMSIDRIASKTSYRVVPFSGALDTIEVYNLIMAEK
jgi:hypothetical protein